MYYATFNFLLSPLFKEKKTVDLIVTKSVFHCFLYFLFCLFCLFLTFPCKLRVRIIKKKFHGHNSLFTKIYLNVTNIFFKRNNLKIKFVSINHVLSVKEFNLNVQLIYIFRKMKF